jgi:glucuronate isomerase
MRFLSDIFLLNSPLAERLYFGYAAELPIVDYHCHLPPADIAADRRFEHLTALWLEGDHYKWRAMRAQGVEERYCSGDAPPWEKFEQFAATVPYTLRNPLYHWTHMELRNPFGWEGLLSPATAREVYAHAGDCLREPAFSAVSLLQRRRVEVLCTTDDPADDLAFHRQFAASGSALRMYPTFRPDKYLAAQEPAAYNAWLDRLEAAAGQEIRSFEELVEALRKRAAYFASLGCRLSDHGLEYLYASDSGAIEASWAFFKVRRGHLLSPDELLALRSALLHELGLLYHELGWVMQFHLGAQRNNNSRMMARLGPDGGFDSIGDWPQAQPLARYLDRLDQQERLAPCILYNLNPADNEIFASMCGNFQEGPRPGKLQWGAAWWFLDQKDGIERQLDVLSQFGLLRHFVGMLTDSRSFLSYSRHEYFRRILCERLASEALRGELPADEALLGQAVQEICYENAKRYFGF